MKAKTIIYTLLILAMSVSLYMAIDIANFHEKFSSFAMGPVKGLIGILLMVLIDEVVFFKINTIEEIKKNNTAYAIIILGNALVIAAALLVA